jgi:hypothetical protein
LSLIARMRRQPGAARTDAPQGPGTTPAGPAEEHDGPTGAPRSDGGGSTAERADAERPAAAAGAHEEPTAGGPPAGEPADEPPTDDPPTGSGSADRRGPVRRVLAVVLTVLAVLLVLAALVAPDTMADLTPLAFVRIPVEALVLVALVLVLPGRAGKLLAAVVGVLLGLLTVLKLFDIGYSAALNRMFDPIADYSQLHSAVGLVAASIGTFGAVVAVILAVLLIVALLVFMTWAMLRLTRLVVHRSSAAMRTVAVLAVVWVGCAVLGAQIVPGLPVASTSASALVYDHAVQARETIVDQQAFAAEVGNDAFRNVPADQLLTGLRGKDVIVAYIESYGRSAVEGPAYADRVDAVLNSGTEQLKAAGIGSRSAYLTSSTAGGYSWLAHSTLMSGLWINTQPRYEQLTQNSDRFTLDSAFHRAGWRTMAVMPALTEDWPEGRIFGYDQVYDFRNLGYKGPQFSYALMPDQYTMSFIQHTERDPADRKPVMAEVALVSSHSPWAPLPHMVDWNQVGDGTVFGPQPAQGKSPDEVWKDPAQVRTEYRNSIEYSLQALIGYARTYGDDNLVLVFLGDHQPAPYVAGEGTNHDVPITVVAKDPKVLDQMSGWGWTDGVKPSPDAPVWRMDSFRDKFLTTFGTGGQGAH